LQFSGDTAWLALSSDEAGEPITAPTATDTAPSDNTKLVVFMNPPGA
jgi:hypothetical protein